MLHGQDGVEGDGERSLSQGVGEGVRRDVEGKDILGHRKESLALRALRY